MNEVREIGALKSDFSLIIDTSLDNTVGVSTMNNSLVKTSIVFTSILIAATAFVASQEPPKQVAIKGKFIEQAGMPSSSQRLRIKSVEVIKEESPGYKRVKLTLCPWYGKISTQGLAEEKLIEVHDQQVVMIVESGKLPHKDDIITLTISSHLEHSPSLPLVPCSCDRR